MKPDTLNIQEDSLYIVKGQVALGNVEKSVKSIAKLVVKSDGTVIDFDYIYFVPVIIAGNKHLTYKIGAMKNGKRVDLMMNTEDEELNPCPPGRPGSSL
jgi:ribosomal protein S6